MADAMTDTSTTMNRQYGGDGLVERIDGALTAAGRDPSRATREDVERVEEFHLGGRAATRALAELAGFEAGERVLDLGCGVGGPARTLASEFGCRVDALDATTEFCRVARELNARTGLDDAVRIHEGDALATPFEDASFDGVVVQHVGMNIADKPRLLRECQRVLRPGGRLALYDICRGDGAPPVYPVPWADRAELSHLATPDEWRSMAEDAGFEPRVWQDATAEGLEWLRASMAESASLPEDAPPPVGLNLLIGESMPVKGQNLVRNLEEGRVAVVRGVLLRSG